MIRRQPPSFSPVPAKAIFNGLLSTISSNVFVTNYRELKQYLLDRFAATDVLLLNSGTSALQMAIEIACKSDSECKVALPAYGCYDLATATLGASVSSVLYDIDPVSLRPNLNSLRAALTEGVKAVVVVHPYGIPIDQSSVRILCDEFNVTFIEDAAQSVGGSFRGVVLGSFGDFTVLSFGRGKGWSGGGGGALLSKSTGISGLLASKIHKTGLRNVVNLLGAKLLGRPSIYGVPMSFSSLSLGETVFHDPSPPEPISKVSVSVIRGTMEAALREAEIRRNNVSKLLIGIEGIEKLVPILMDEVEPGYVCWVKR